MDKIFFNQDIFNGYTDYALGGFYAPENAEINYSTIVSKVRDKIKRLIDDFYIRGMAAGMYSNEPFTMQDGKNYVYTMLMDNLYVMPSMTDTEGFVDSIMNSDKMVKWLDETIKPRIVDYMKYEITTTGKFEAQKGIENLAFKEGVEMTPEYEEAKSAVDDMTLEQFIEQLSTIEI